MSGSRLSGYIKLGCWIFGIWFFLWVFTPFWVEKSPAHQDFAKHQDEAGIPYGALYYSDLPFIIDASMELRDTWRFLPGRKKQSEKKPE